MLLGKSVDSSAHVTPFGAELPVRSRRCGSTIELGDPSLAPIRIGRTVQTGDDFGRDLKALIFGQRESVLDEFAGSGTHGAQCDAR